MRTILIVDDEPAFVKILTACLVKRGVECLAAVSLDDALALIASRSDIRAIFLDYSVTEGRVGLWISALRDCRPGIAIIGNSADERETEFLAAYADAFIRKPLRAVTVMQLLDTLTGRFEG